MKCEYVTAEMLSEYEKWDFSISEQAHRKDFHILIQKIYTRHDVKHIGTDMSNLAFICRSKKNPFTKSIRNHIILVPLDKKKQWLAYHD